MENGQSGQNKRRSVDLDDEENSEIILDELNDDENEIFVLKSHYLFFKFCKNLGRGTDHSNLTIFFQTSVQIRIIFVTLF